MKKIKSIEVFEELGQSELLKVKGGDERNYYYVVINGEKIKIYI
ncbi:hypothetical protein [Marinifilum flexuosum]|nr:hypothetical protein [Marinifilum flexuosum]